MSETMEIEQQSIFSKEIQHLLAKEKIARLNNDHLESARILTSICQTAFDTQEYDKLNELIKILAKKRGQAKKALVDMVQLCMKFVQQLPRVNQKLALIEALKEVTDKKIFLEVEYARCCLMMVKHKEDEENINEAAKILQEVQVETYGSMDKREKLEFILYQMKIMIKKRDYVRLFIISKKINKKNIEEKGIEDLKILYYSYLIFYYTHENKYFENAECYKAIYDTLRKNNELQVKLPEKTEFGLSLNIVNLLENYIIYLVLCTYDNEQVKLLLDLKANYADALEKEPRLNSLVDAMLSTEIITTDIQQYKLDKDIPIQNLKILEAFSEINEHHALHLRIFKKQLIQHNLRILEKYYDKVSMERIGQLVGVSEDIAEEELCEMINNKLVTAKINRLDKIITFKQKKTENDLLNEWRYDVHRILDLVDQTTNLINREYDIDTQNA